MIVVHTNVVYALAGRRDKHHAGCAGWFRGNDEVLLVPPAVAAGACSLIGRYAFKLAGLGRLRPAPRG